MSDPVACWNGKLVPEKRLSLSLGDIGFVQGVTVTEMLRTFRGELFEVEAHLDRLEHSLFACGISLPESRDDLTRLMHHVAERNHRLLTSGELAVCLIATPGVNAAYAPLPVKESRPTLCIYSLEITRDRWARAYAEGLSVMTSKIKQIPGDIIDPTLKVRSRLHWWLADRDVKRQDPNALAVLLDAQGHLTETSVGNLIIANGEQLATPLRSKTLAGVSQQYVIRLAAELGMPCAERDLTPHDALHAQEIWMTCTTGCILPVTHFNGRPVGTGRPGSVYRSILHAWSQRVGVSIDGG
jgi:branched-subunit amino acid aminotransferase/4-amino-4-deoxychorismate lyase